MRYQRLVRLEEERLDHVQDDQENVGEEEKAKDGKTVVRREHGRLGEQDLRQQRRKPEVDRDKGEDAQGAKRDIGIEEHSLGVDQIEAGGVQDRQEHDGEARRVAETDERIDLA